MFSRLARAWRRDILFRLQTGVFLVVALATGLYTLYAVEGLKDEAERRLQERIGRLSTVVAESLARPLYDFNDSAISSVVGALGASPDVVWVRVVDPEGKVLAQAGATDALPGNTASVQRSISYADGRGITPVGHMELALSRSSIDRDLQHALQQTGITLLLMAVAIMAAIWRVGRRIARPFSDIQESLEKLTRGETDIKLSGIGRVDQIGRLSESVRSFRDTLVLLREAQQQREILLTEKAAMLDNALVGIIALKNRQVVSCNRRAEELFGYAPGEMINLDSAVVYADEESWRQVGAAYADLTLEGGRSVEVRMRRKNGEVFWAAMAGHPHDPANPLAGESTWICTDISPRKAAEEELARHQRQLEATVEERTRELAEAKEQAEEASRSKSDFLSNMSHEIRTPMNAILGLTYLLGNRPLGPNEQDIVRKIRGAGRSLLGIINDILDFSKIEAGKLEIDRAPFRLSDVLDNVATIMSSAVGDRTIELLVGSAPPGATCLKGDALRLEQVLINLAGNAIKFTEAGEVALSITELGRRDGKVALRFAVRDTGIGIAPDKQAEIFSAFSQADSSTTRRFGGTGLGLAISRRLVALMGGEIRLLSQPGVGSEFFFTLELELDAEAEAGLAPADTGCRLLIANDHAATRELLAATARSLGWQAETATSGEEALARAEAAGRAGAPFHALLLDWVMPGLDGLAAAARLRAALGEARPPVIVTASSQDRELLLKHPLAPEADAILGKPVTASSLQGALEDVLGRRAGQVPADARAGTRLAGLRILVVDDSDINCEVATRILEEEAAIVHQAGNGQEALEQLASPRHGVDIVLMDVQMPVMDGFEATRRIRASPHLAGLPVVALTAGAFRNQQEAALAAGMNGFIPKPFETEQLVALILELTSRTPADSLQATPAAPAAPAADAMPRLDLEQAGRAWGRKKAAYARFLRRFAAEHGRDGEELTNLLAAGSRPEAAALAHKLKGVAANLSITTVARLAETLEKDLKADGDGLAACRALQAALIEAGAAIATFAEAVEAEQGASA